MSDFYTVQDLWTAHSYRVRLWALCRRCGRTTELRPYDLLKKSKITDKKLHEVAKLLKCKSCGQHQSVLIPGVVDPEKARRAPPR